jgi:hypothetical protein
VDRHDEAGHAGNRPGQQTGVRRVDDLGGTTVESALALSSFKTLPAGQSKEAERLYRQGLTIAEDLARAGFVSGH